jgi:hypothetical protein
MFTSPPRSSTWSLSCRFSTKTLYSLSSIRATLPAHLKLLDVIIRIIYSEGWFHEAFFTQFSPGARSELLMVKKDFIYELIYEYGVMRRAVASDIFKSSLLLLTFIRLAYFINPLNEQYCLFWH